MNYTIKPNDTLSQIAEEQNVSVQQIVDLNESIKSHEDLIFAGDSLVLPDDAKLTKQESSSDAASEAALSADSENDDSPVQSCPYQSSYFTIKPLRYGVVHEEDESALPKTLLTTQQLSSLNEHKYNVRQLYQQVVYLYNIKDNYLLEVEYGDGKPDAGMLQSASRCVFGDAPTAVTDALPYFKQPKNAQVIMWLAPQRISERWANVLESHPEQILKVGQKIDFSMAAKGKATDVYQLTDDSLPELLADAQVSESINWTNPSIAPLAQSQTNKLIVPYKKLTPNNHYAVCLIDAIGITSDLCREYSASYQALVQEIGSSAHPYIMGKLTQKVIDKVSRESTQGMDEIAQRIGPLYTPYPEYIDDLFQMHLLPKSEQEKYQYFIANKIQQAQKNTSKSESIKIVGNDFNLVPYDGYTEDLVKIHSLKGTEREKFQNEVKEKVKKSLEIKSKKNSENLADVKFDNYQGKKADLEKNIYKDKMDEYLNTHESFHKQVAERLETLATDWLTWLRHEQSDQALSWLDPYEIDTYHHREAIMLSMLDNLNVSNAGDKEIQSWVDAWLAVTKDQKPKESDNGLATHVALSIGFVKDTLMSGSPLISLLATFSGTAEQDLENIKTLIKKRNYSATVYTDELLYVYVNRLVITGVQSESSRILIQDYMKIFRYRYSYSFQLFKFKLGKVLAEASVSQMAEVSQVTGHFEGKPINDPILANKTVTLYQLDERIYSTSSVLEQPAGAATKNPFVFIAQRVKDSALKSTGKFILKANDLLKKYDNKLFGMLLFTQLINAYEVFFSSAELKKSGYRRGFDYSKSVYDLMASSISIIDRVRVKQGLVSLSNYIKEGGDEKIAIKALNSIDRLFDRPVVTLSTRMAMDYKSISVMKSIISFPFKSLPIIGFSIGIVSSWLVRKDDEENSQNIFAKRLAFTSLLANGVGLSASILICLGFAASPLGVVIIAAAVISLTADLIHGLVTDDPVEALLKRSFWGTGNYQYSQSLTSLEDRINYFKVDLQNEDDSKLEKLRNIQNQELGYFCDELFRPASQIASFSCKELLTNWFNGRVIKPGSVVAKLTPIKGHAYLSDFTFKLYFPYYQRGISQVAIKQFYGYTNDDVEVSILPQNKKLELNHLETDLLSVNLIEKTDQLTAILVAEISEKIKTNYKNYKLVVDFVNPSGYPVTLKYELALDNNRRRWDPREDSLSIAMKRIKNFKPAGDNSGLTN